MNQHTNKKALWFTKSGGQFKDAQIVGGRGMDQLLFNKCYMDIGILNEI